MKEFEPEERRWYLAAKLLTDQLSPEEQSEWETFTADERFRSNFEQIRKHWRTLESLPYQQIDAEKDWEHVISRIREVPVHNISLGSSKLYRYAAVITLMIAASFLIWKFTPSADVKDLTSVIEAPNGARTSVTLPDSSTVWLNAGSRISYDQDFGSENRNIDLQGEAYFEVKKKDIPFRVHTSVFDIKVLGTAFNIKAYPGDDMASTTLLRGSLEVSRVRSSGSKESIILKPDERVILKGLSGESLIHETNIDGAAEADWKDGWLTVRGESLGELSKKIERIYNVKVVFKSESLKQYRYNGRIQQFSLEQVLKALELTSPVRFTIHEKTVTLSENEFTRSKYQQRNP
jgi:transmembrane sensor